MDIWLLRHGHADQPAGIRDADRPLSTLGRHQAKTIGSFLARTKPPDVVLCSPFLRARQTASLVAEVCGGLTTIETVGLLSGTEPAKIVAEVNRQRVASVLLVGHEPLMSTLVAYLTTGHAYSVARMTPCTLGLIRSGGKLRPGGGVLDLLVPPEILVKKASLPSE